MRCEGSETGGDQVTGNDRFEAIVRAFEQDSAVTSGKMMSAQGLKVHGRIFAMFPKGRFVVKLPKERVDELVRARAATRFDPGHGRVMKEWAVISEDPDNWLKLAKEAYDFVKLKK